MAVAAAVAEARGLRIAPQIRRQVPEAWRRVLPVPLAAAGYGVLLGLGFTTFVLSFAVWALAGASIALGDPALGLAIGLAFGAGRALPVIALAPFAGSERGGAITAAMCERPAILLGLRRVDAVALAAVRARAGDASRERPAARARGRRELFAGGAYDPTAAGGLIAWQRPNGVGAARCAAAPTPALPGTPSRARRRPDRVARAATRSWSPTRPRSPGASGSPAPGAGVLARVGRAAGLARARRGRHATGSGRAPPAGEPRLLLEPPRAERARPARRCSAAGCSATSPGPPAAS